MIGFEQWVWLSPAIIVGSALVFLLLERIWPYNAQQRAFREGFWTDLLGYGVAQSYVLGLAIAAIIQFVDKHAGGARWHWVSAWPLSAQVLFFFITHDFYIYWFHRLQHRLPLLWRIHEAHHSAPDVDWLSGTRSHAFEILINQTVEFMPIALLGAAPEVALIKATLDAVWGMYIHSNLSIRAGWLQYFINGPEMHRWHHSNQVEAPGKNFSTKLATWDWLFGTAYYPAERAQSYGLLGGEQNYPRSGPWAYFSQLAHIFRRTAVRG